MIDLTVDEELAPPVNQASRIIELLARLDFFVRPGIDEVTFNAIFARCSCGMVTTRRMFNLHECMGWRRHAVIDLTVDE